MMKEKTLEALRGSIQKWEGIVAGTMEDHGEDNCPLCALFLEKNCRGCPVRQKTGHPNCHFTPYREYTRYEPTRSKDASRNAAQAELDFLKSLLPACAE